MKTRKRESNLASDTSVFGAGLTLQEESLGLLLAEIRALQAILPLAVTDLPTDAETEEGYDNMPV